MNNNEDMDNKIMALLSTISAIVVSALFFLVIFFKKSTQISKAFFEFSFSRTNNKLLCIEKYLSVKTKSTDVRETLEDIQDAMQIESVIGIYAEKKRREGLIALHQSMSHCIHWKEIKRANEYIEIGSDKKATVRAFSSKEILVFRVSWFGYFISLFACILTFSPYILFPPDSSNLAQLIAPAAQFFCYVIAVIYFHVQLSPQLAANKIRNTLDSNAAK